MKTQFVVVDTPFNRAHSAEFIGRKYPSLDKVPSYTMVQEIPRKSFGLVKALVLCAVLLYFVIGAVSCASTNDCPAYGASKRGTVHGYNSPYYRR